jgi:hypothetical protein
MTTLAAHPTNVPQRVSVRNLAGNTDVLKFRTITHQNSKKEPHVLFAEAIAAIFRGKHGLLPGTCREKVRSAILVEQAKAEKDFRFAVYGRSFQFVDIEPCDGAMGTGHMCMQVHEVGSPVPHMVELETALFWIRSTA